MIGGYSQGGGGASVPPPPNETLHWVYYQQIDKEMEWLGENRDIEDYG